MAQQLDVHFAPLSTAPAGAVVVLAQPEFALGATAKAYDEKSKGMLKRAAHAADFTGKGKGSIEVLAPAGLDTPRIVVAAAGNAGKELDRLLLGGYIYAQAAARKGDTATLVAEVADAAAAGGEALAVDLAMGALLRSYTFKKYQTKKARTLPAPVS
jgi:leucyl aminopeptidase